MSGGGEGSGRGLDAILATVRRLHRLAGDPGATEGEAAAAAAAAARLIERHRLDVASLGSGEDEAPAPVVEAPEIDAHPLDAARVRIAWRGILAGAVARSQGCRVWWSGPRLHVAGTPSRVQACRSLYAWLAREIDSLGTHAARGHGRSYGHAWRVGCATRIGERLRAAAAAGAPEAATRARAEAYARGGEGALVRVEARIATLAGDAARTDDLVRARVGPLRPGRTATVRSASGWQDGHAAGDRMRLDARASLGSGGGGTLPR
jgi:hypothetical protein